MKKYFETPELELLRMYQYDVLTASGDDDDNSTPTPEEGEPTGGDGGGIEA